MKRIFLILTLFCCLIISKADNSQKLVNEGYTYWYSSELSGLSTYGEYGLTIGGKTEINGKMWNPVSLIRRAIIDHNNNCKEMTDSPVVIAYVREENGTLYTGFSNFESPAYKPMELVWKGMFNFSYPEKEFEEFSVYGIGGIGSKFKYGTEQGGIDYTITNIDEIENRGNVYTKVTAIKSGEDYLPIPDKIEIVESIGAFADYYGETTAAYSELFYAPFTPYFAASAKYLIPTLRYVTVGEDHKIIYENMGGFKLWEYDPSGVETVEADSNESVRWFNLQGVEIAAPEAPGIYIRKTGNKVEKIRK